MKISKCFDHLRKAVDDTIQDLEIQRDSAQDELWIVNNDLHEALAILSPARALAVEIERRFALRLDPGPTEQDFRELLRLLTEGS
jgi:SpoU rRNA methylase family enzyme